MLKCYKCGEGFDRLRGLWVVHDKRNKGVQTVHAACHRRAPLVATFLATAMGLGLELGILTRLRFLDEEDCTKLTEIYLHLKTMGG